MMDCKPHPEVVNSQPTVLIVGYGHVGQRIGRYFTLAHWTDETKCVRTVANNEVVRLSTIHYPYRYELGFLCVPTPQGADGLLDLSALREAYTYWKQSVRCWCIKSSVNIGDTEALGPNVCVSPEYYGETVRHPLVAASPDTFEILGGPPEITQAFAEAWTLVTNSYTRIYQADARTVELCKLMENSWIALKVSFCNEFYDLAELAGVDWHTLRELWLADPRVSRSHTYVFPKNRGWGGKCLPKDTTALCAWAGGLGYPAGLMEAVRKYNRELRSGMEGIGGGGG